MRHDDIAVRRSPRAASDAEPAGRVAAAARPLLRLDRASRHDRFHGFMDDSFIERYAEKCANDGTVIIGYIEDGVVRGAAELHPPEQSPDAQPEIAFSVEASVRRLGVGSILFKKLIAEARVKDTRACGLPPARRTRRCGPRQQVRCASDIPPRRIHRQHRSDAAARSPNGTTCDREQSMPRARWRISIAHIGRSGCECLAGAGRPDRAHLLQSPYRSIGC